MKHSKDAASIDQSRAQKWFQGKRFRKIIKVAIPIVILVTGVCIAAYFLFNRGSFDRDNSTAATLPGILGDSEGDLVDRAFRNADTLQANGQYNEAKATILTAIQGKTGLLLTKGYHYLTVLAVNQEAWDDALLYGQKFEDAQHSVVSANLLAKTYIGKGDKATAISYYQKAIDRMNAIGFDKDDENKQAQLKRFQTNIMELQQ